MTMLQERQDYDVEQPGTTSTVIEWILGILGVLAVGVGLVLQFAEPEGTLEALWWTWNYGDIAEAWKYGLLIGGSLSLSAAFGIASWRSYVGDLGMTTRAVVTTLLAVVALLAAVAIALTWII